MKEKIVEIVNIVLGLRKLMVMLLLFTLGVIFRLHNLIDGGQLVDLLKNTALGFFAANGCEHFSTAIKDYVNSKGQKVEEEVVEAKDGQ
jgi:predicted Co/Zn/Cd cation transporter (cation efflux family)